MPIPDISHRFNFHPANDRTGPLHDSIRSECDDLAHALDRNLPDSREKSLAITKLEEVMFWANACVARNIQ